MNKIWPLNLPAYTFNYSKTRWSQTLNKSYKEKVKQDEGAESDRGSMKDAIVREDLSGKLAFAEIKGNKIVNVWIWGGREV